LEEKKKKTTLDQYSRMNAMLLMNRNMKSKKELPWLILDLAIN